MSQRMAVMVSGNGTNLQNIIDASKNNIIHSKIVYVIADRPCYALQIAKKEGIASQLIERGRGFSKKAHDFLYQQVDLIVLAGFLSVLSPSFCKSWSRQIINIHPSLLPAYGGKGMWGDYVHKAVLKNKEKKSGATVHFVTQDLDQGAIIIQKSCPISPQENLDSLKKKVSNIEHQILLQAISQIE